MVTNVGEETNGIEEREREKESEKRDLIFEVSNTS